MHERRRQLDKWPIEHDDEHDDGELALAACCYAAPSQLYIQDHRANAVTYADPWPWHPKYDLRLSYGERRENPGNPKPDPDTYTAKERIDLLVKAGALIAAEIDRLQRLADKTEGGD
jgi:hypothetical protein